jgi:hypothetical protein
MYFPVPHPRLVIGGVSKIGKLLNFAATATAILTPPVAGIIIGKSIRDEMKKNRKTKKDK